MNLDLPPTLISRFDLLYLVLDNVDEALDRRLAQHLVGLYLEDTPDNGNGQDILVSSTHILATSCAQYFVCFSPWKTYLHTSLTPVPASTQR